MPHATPRIHGSRKISPSKGRIAQNPLEILRGGCYNAEALGAIAQLVEQGKRTSPPAVPNLTAKYGRKISASLICLRADSLSRPAFRKCRPVRVSPLSFWVTVVL